MLGNGRVHVTRVMLWSVKTCFRRVSRQFHWISETCFRRKHTKRFSFILTFQAGASPLIVRCWPPGLALTHGDAEPGGPHEPFVSCYCATDVRMTDGIRCGHWPVCVSTHATYCSVLLYSQLKLIHCLTLKNWLWRRCCVLRSPDPYVLEWK